MTKYIARSSSKLQNKLTTKGTQHSVDTRRIFCSPAMRVASPAALWPDFLTSFTVCTFPVSVLRAMRDSPVSPTSRVRIYSKHDASIAVPALG